MVKAGFVAALAVLVSALVSAPAAGAIPPRFSKPVTLGRQLRDSNVLRAEDVSGDGIPDLISTGNVEAIAVAVNRGGSAGDAEDVAVWLGKGDGSFRHRSAYQLAAESFAMDVKDINGDGKPDLIVAGEARRGPITILLNVGEGRFRRDRVVRSVPWASGVAASDVNKDGLVDLVVAGDARRDVAVLLRTPDGGFAAARRFAVLGNAGSGELEIDDVNGDGTADLVIAGFDRVVVLLGNGDGTFRAANSPLRYGASYLHLADINRDSKPDIIVASPAMEGRDGSVAMLLGTATGPSALQRSHVYSDPDRDSSAPDKGLSSPMSTATPTPTSLLAAIW